MSSDNEVLPVLVTLGHFGDDSLQHARPPRLLRGLGWTATVEYVSPSVDWTRLRHGCADVDDGRRQPPSAAEAPWASHPLNAQS